MDRTEKLSICNYDIFVAKTPNYDIFVAKTRNYDIFVAKIYDYALIDSFWGFPMFIDSPTSYATLVLGPWQWSLPPDPREGGEFTGIFV